MRGRALLALLALALLIGGCGGGEDSESASSESTAAREEKGASAGQGAAGTGQKTEGQAEEQGTEGSSAHGAAPNPPIATERTPGSKAVAPDVPVTKGGDNSIQAFGVEGETGEAAQAAANLRAYLSARVDGDWAAACAAASEEYRSQLATLIERARGAQKPEGCTETLELLFGEAPKQALEESAQVKQVLSFRVEENGYAYLIYEDGEGAIRFIAMANDNGAWKVNTIEPAEFPETEEQGSNQ